MTIFQAAVSCHKDRTVMRPSFLYNGNSHTGKAASLSWEMSHCGPPFGICGRSFVIDNEVSVSIFGIEEYLREIFIVTLEGRIVFTCAFFWSSKGFMIHFWSILKHRMVILRLYIIEKFNNSNSKFASDIWFYPCVEYVHRFLKWWNRPFNVLAYDTIKSK